MTDLLLLPMTRRGNSPTGSYCHGRSICETGALMNLSTQPAHRWIIPKKRFIGPNHLACPCVSQEQAKEPDSVLHDPHLI
ncbi:hypothetical protein, partial [Devosia sp.]|uniref:hypothetical protein n=1 Tax=Devosia sp. TaxID=1871048 RepID=UPI001ACA79A8